jgi:hypothetical protein
MPTNRRLVRRPRRGRLSDAAEMHLWLGSGLQECPHPFASDDERREAWLRNRERLMACFGKGGRRPMAWWAYDAPFPYPGYDHEQAALYEADLLAEQEKAELLTQWRRYFDKAQEPGFGFCAGHVNPGDIVTWLKGPAAKRAHYAWAGIPRALIRKWVMELKRRVRTTKKLEAGTSEPPKDEALKHA